MCKRWVCEEVDKPGPYVIIHDKAAVTPSLSVGDMEIIAKLDVRKIVNVVEVVISHHDKRVRGRIDKPAGWISLMDTDTLRRWAVKHDPE
mmetsp:Transcript_78763/g.206750  ORF Transcript_78763/g.206750 Transcript_78763/m.206750 type:complete len:90 (+) Transcript_78763:826-1095(+)